MGEAYELQQGPRDPTPLAEGTTRFLPGQSNPKHSRDSGGTSAQSADGSYLELCEELPGLCEVSGTSFKPPLEVSIEGSHMRGCHADI